jgi:predicted RNA binding protein YcfA (HicA-like mRNA interferase family)
MAKGYYRDVTKLLSDLGYIKTNGGDGSHEKWISDDDNLPTLTVPFNMKSRHTANGITKDAGLGKKF